MPKISELRARLANARSLPWRPVRDGDEFYSLFDEDDEYVLMHSDVHDAKENSELLAAAVNSLPALLEVAEAAEAWMDARVDDNFSSVRLLEAIKKLRTIPNGTIRSPK